MRLPGVKTAKKFSRWLQARVLGGALILGYHRISATQDDVYEVCVSPENFAGHMEALSKYARPISLSKLVQCLKQDSLPAKSVAVTFDDGYADNLYIAKPILEKYEIPATVFICTGYVGREFWWDELERLVISSQADLGALRLEVGENQFAWRQRKANVHVDFNVRSRFRYALYHFLLELDVEDQDQTMRVIRNWSGVFTDKTPVARSMSQAELLQLVDGGLIELGSHTRHHLLLPRLSLERQRDEVVFGKHDLEELLGRQIEGFAYPNGKASEHSKSIVRESGFSYACTSEPNLLRNNRNIYQIPRFWPQDWDGERFLRWFQRWIW